MDPTETPETPSIPELTKEAPTPPPERPRSALLLGLDIARGEAAAEEALRRSWSVFAGPFGCGFGTMNRDGHAAR